MEIKKLKKELEFVKISANPQKTKDMLQEHQRIVNQLKLDQKKEIQKIQQECLQRLQQANEEAIVDKKLLNETDETVRYQRNHIVKQDYSREAEFKKRYGIQLTELRDYHMRRYEKLEEQFEAHRQRHDNYVDDVMKEKLTLIAERNKAYKLLEEGRN